MRTDTARLWDMTRAQPGGGDIIGELVFARVGEEPRRRKLANSWKGHTDVNGEKSKRNVGDDGVDHLPGAAKVKSHITRGA